MEIVLNEKYTEQSDLMKKRTILQKSIKKYKKDFLSHILNKSYQYYISYLDNMTFEHRKNVNHNFIKIKELQLRRLTDQIKHRDEYLAQANSEFKKKMVKFKTNDGLRPLDEIAAEPVRLPVITKLTPNIKQVKTSSEHSMIV
jgi:hypothetical protein